jgi:hypothetical protein
LRGRLRRDWSSGMPAGAGAAREAGPSRRAKGTRSPQVLARSFPCRLRTSLRMTLSRRRGGAGHPGSR